MFHIDISNTKYIILKIAGILLATILIIFCILYHFFIQAPSATKYPVTVSVLGGQSAISISRELEKEGIVRSSQVTEALMTFDGGAKKIQAGMYVFSGPSSALTIAKRFSNADFGYQPVKITIPEGTNTYKISDIVHSKFPDIATSTFEALILPHEGYLFPETYFFPPMASSTDIISMMQDTFANRIVKLKPQITASGHSESDIIIMASILEEEVKTTADRKMVADLLWRRLASGMPLQVDATLGYITGKTSAELTLSDLKIDSPYNTYINKGLPPHPISNPGMDAIEAAISPTPNKYLFYLSDKNGITHFATTYDEQLKLKQQYLQ